MARSFLEDLASEYFEYFEKCFIKRNVVISGHSGKSTGGIKGEIDIIALNKNKKNYTFCELSEDAQSWDKRLKKMENKLRTIIKYTKQNEIKNYEILVVFSSFFSPRGKQNIYNQDKIKKFTEKYKNNGIKVKINTSYEFISKVVEKIYKLENCNKTIPTQFPILRILQLTIKLGILKTTLRDVLEPPT